MLRRKREWSATTLLLGAIMIFIFMTAVASCVFVLCNALGYPNAVYLVMLSWMSWAIVRTFWEEEPEYPFLFSAVAAVLLGMSAASALVAQWAIALFF